jgi:hypothetical protein
MQLHRGVRRDAWIFCLDYGRLMGDPEVPLPGRSVWKYSACEAFPILIFSVPFRIIGLPLASSVISVLLALGITPPCTRYTVEVPPAAASAAPTLFAPTSYEATALDIALNTTRIAASGSTIDPSVSKKCKESA